MTTTSGRAVGRWARCDDALWSRSGAGTVVVPGGGRAAVALTPAEHAIWAHVAELAAVPSLVAACGIGDETVRSALASLAALGVVREVT